MFWGYFAASGTGCIESVLSTMKSLDYQGILERNIRKLCLSHRSWVLQQDNDPKHPRMAQVISEKIVGSSFFVEGYQQIFPRLYIYTIYIILYKNVSSLEFEIVSRWN